MDTRKASFHIRLHRYFTVFLRLFPTEKVTLSFQMDTRKASFHIPLHRYFSVFLRQAVKAQNFTLKQLLPDPEFLTLLMQHPLRVQVSALQWEWNKQRVALAVTSHGVKETIALQWM